MSHEGNGTGHRLCCMRLALQPSCSSVFCRWKNVHWKIFLLDFFSGNSGIIRVSPKLEAIMIHTATFEGSWYAMYSLA